ncbi:hypothetical protein L228DRAFT_267405 [Xylona heveae TC161]|uniref:LITAF domain-containing protein n=1 Tax=Xylona heveae (strain CBS 132557 / TC161) TaxID=1328760 RepID=A0A165HEP3_XYLHT|nr:hypothetical protein L228DRAFT_267405 [Xylona heveae TC161]KZF23398.1 hypothetical protein L228DRAFT_267405 [Xylona heveae TC161]
MSAPYEKATVQENAVPVQHVQAYPQSPEMAQPPQYAAPGVQPQQPYYGTPPAVAGSPPPQHMGMQQPYGSPMQPQQPGYFTQVAPGQPQSPPLQQQYTQSPVGAISPAPQQQQQQQQQQNSNEKTYKNATPLAVLGRSAAPVDCPACGNRCMTRITYKTGNTTHAWAFALCCLTGLFCFVPYLMNGFKDVDHHCGSCGVLLATWHKSGTVDVHQYS